MSEELCGSHPNRRTPEQILEDQTSREISAGTQDVSHASYSAANVLTSYLSQSPGLVIGTEEFLAVKAG